MDFETFWTHYPKKVAKQDAIKAWSRLTMFDVDAIDAAYADHLRAWAGKDPQYLPHPATWLRGRRWEDEVPRRRVKVGDPGYYDRLSEDLL
jgi:hypothetical protein